MKKKTLAVVLAVLSTTAFAQATITTVGGVTTIRYQDGRESRCTNINGNVTCSTPAGQTTCSVVNGVVTCYSPNGKTVCSTVGSVTTCR